MFRNLPLTKQYLIVLFGRVPTQRRRACCFTPANAYQSQRQFDTSQNTKNFKLDFLYSFGSMAKR